MFFKKGKGKNQTPDDAAAKQEDFSLFKKKEQAEPAQSEVASGRFLTLIKGKAAQPADAPADTAAPAAAKAPAQDVTGSPVDNSATDGGSTDAAPVKSSFFSGKKKEAKASAPAEKKSFFSRKSKDSAPVAADASEKSGKTASALSGFLSKGKKPEANAGKADAPKKDKKRVSGRATLGTSKDFHVFVELDNGKQFFWSVTNDHIQEVDPKSVVRAASFSRDDITIRTEKALSFKAAEDLALQEMGEPVHLVNRSKDLSSIYLTREERALTSNFRLFPGQQALDRLLKKAPVKEKPIICGFVFNDRSGKTAMCVLYYINLEGLTTKPQITLNPDNMDFVLNQFALSRKLNKKDVEILLFNNADFLAQVSSLAAYPDERVWRGIPVSQLVRITAAVALLGAIGTVGKTAISYTQLVQVQSTINHLQSQVDRDQEKAGSVIAASIYSFANAMSLDDQKAFDLAGQVWQPGTRIQMTADLNRFKYQLTMPVVTNKMFNNRPSVNSTPPAAQVEQALNFAVPDGCRKDTTSVSGNLNEIQITVVCPTPDYGLSGFRND